MTHPPQIYDCTLCHHRTSLFLITKKSPQFPYYLCPQCKIIFRDPRTFLNREEEKDRYLNHQNLMEDPKYIHFLNQIRRPLLNYLDRSLHGLDFGCGPNPVLAQLFINDGYNVSRYDPLFFPSTDVLKDNHYDFLTCTEVIEHFSHPAEEFHLLNTLLKDEGFMALMTKVYSSDIDFESWYYRKDPTHIVFYQRETWKWLASKFKYQILWESHQGVIFKKQLA